MACAVLVEAGADAFFAGRAAAGGAEEDEAVSFVDPGGVVVDGEAVASRGRRRLPAPSFRAESTGRPP